MILSSSSSLVAATGSDPLALDGGRPAAGVGVVGRVCSNTSIPKLGSASCCVGNGWMVVVVDVVDVDVWLRIHPLSYLLTPLSSFQQQHQPHADRLRLLSHACIASSTVEPIQPATIHS